MPQNLTLPYIGSIYRLYIHVNDVFHIIMSIIIIDYDWQAGTFMLTMSFIELLFTRIKLFSNIFILGVNVRQRQGETIQKYNSTPQAAAQQDSCLKNYINSIQFQFN